jgi:hypothetical protein
MLCDGDWKQRKEILELAVPEVEIWESGIARQGWGVCLYQSGRERRLIEKEEGEERKEEEREGLQLLRSVRRDADCSFPDAHSPDRREQRAEEMSKEREERRKGGTWDGREQPRRVSLKLPCLWALRPSHQSRDQLKRRALQRGHRERREGEEDRVKETRKIGRKRDLIQTKRGDRSSLILHCHHCCLSLLVDRRSQTPLATWDRSGCGFAFADETQKERERGRMGQRERERDRDRERENSLRDVNGVGDARGLHGVGCDGGRTPQEIPWLVGTHHSSSAWPCVDPNSHVEIYAILLLTERTEVRQRRQGGGREEEGGGTRRERGRGGGERERETSRIRLKHSSM